MALDRRRLVVGAVVGRPAARARLHPDQQRDDRLLRRIPAGRQPVRREPHRPRREDRPAALALPDGQARHLELRHADRADPARRQRQRPADSRSVPGDQAGLPLFVQPRDRRTDLADRDEAGAAVEGPGREAVADAAASDQAGAVRIPGPDRGSPDRLHARDQEAGARRSEARRRARAVFRAAEPSRQSRRRAANAQLPRRRRRREHHRTACRRSDERRHLHHLDGQLFPSAGGAGEGVRLAEDDRHDDFSMVGAERGQRRRHAAAAGRQPAARHPEHLQGLRSGASRPSTSTPANTCG